MWQAAKSSNNISANVIYGVNRLFECFKIYTTYRNTVSVGAKATLDSDIPLYVFSLLQNLRKTAILASRMTFNILFLALEHSKEAMA